MDCGSTNNYVPNENGLVPHSGEVSETRVVRCCACSEALNLGPIFQCINVHRTCSSCHDKGPKKCFVCSLSVTKRYLSLEVVLESMNIPCIVKAHENTSIYGPCSCPLPGCNFHSDYKDFASHFTTTHHLVIRSFIYDMMYGTVIHHDEETIVLRELNDGILFLIKNKVESMGNMITLYHFTPTTLNKEFSFDLVARTQSGPSYCLCDAKVQNIQADRSSNFLLIPPEFFQPLGCMLEIFIRRIGAAKLE